ncbi:MAG TPA: alpha-L-fucosidase [Armatimonadota bacterium]|jgi:alpha-L-fucosidase
MPTSRRRFIHQAAASGLALAELRKAPQAQAKEDDGPFSGSEESLSQYRYPAWFRDAKLGIWAHWGPQSVPMAGDWYARQMYVQGHTQYQHHLEHYGHPSKLGYKDIIPLWKAERWDPDGLMALYKQAGARYFVSMGCHHDNFDLWNSRHHRWNAVEMGPQRDVVGTWQKAARKLGLRFGVSEHLGASFTWFQDSHRSDKTGPLAGVPYDGANAEFQDLYHWPAAPGDTAWYSTDARWHQEWLRRITDLVDRYQPDLLYTDGGIPFGDVGHGLVAHLYNLKARGGDTQAVYTCKQESKGMWVQDLERGVMAAGRPEPWQTDTSIGDWFYNQNWKYRGADWVIHMLVDIVSKNGNLLLNVVQRPDGTLDPEAHQVLEGMAAWIATNGEAIYGTRPWGLYGEGPSRAKGGHFNEDYAYGPRDVRFTTKGDTLYATALGWPEDGTLRIRTLARNAPGIAGEVDRVELLGSPGRLRFTRTPEALEVSLPDARPGEHAFVLRIRGLKPASSRPVAPPDPPEKVSARGDCRLLAAAATLQGRLQVQGGSEQNIGFWDDAKDTASWRVQFDAPGDYAVTARIATANGPTSCALAAGTGASLTFEVPLTGGWDRFQDVAAGTLHVPEAGVRTLTLGSADPGRWKAMNLASLTLVKVK